MVEEVKGLIPQVLENNWMSTGEWSNSPSERIRASA